MARPSKLTPAQCEKARKLRADGVSVPILAKKFKVSESSMYKVMDGSYAAVPKTQAINEAPAAVAVEIPLAVGRVPVPGSTPSIFRDQNLRRRSTDHPSAQLHPTMAQLLRTAEQAIGTEIDDLTLAAAELIVAKAHYTRALAHSH